MYTAGEVRIEEVSVMMHNTNMYWIQYPERQLMMKSITNVCLDTYFHLLHPFMP